MKITLNVKVDGDDSLWHRQVERPYPGVPRPDDWIFLGGDDNGQGLMATPVAVVTWDNDGTVGLRCDMTGSASGTRQLLEQLGFTRA